MSVWRSSLRCACMRSERIEEQCGRRGIPAITAADRVLLPEGDGMARTSLMDAPADTSMLLRTLAPGRREYAPCVHWLAVRCLVVRMRPRLIHPSLIR